MDKNEQGGGGFLLGLLLGGAIGAIAALLYAPMRGEETRGVLAQKTNEYTNAAMQKTVGLTDQLKQSAGEYSGKAGEMVGGVVDSVKSKATDVASGVASTVTDKAQGVVSSVADKASGAVSKGKDFVAAKTQQAQEVIEAYKDGAGDRKQELQNTGAAPACDDSEAAA